MARAMNRKDRRMHDRIKRRLDADWADFLDQLNQAFEDAYAVLIEQAVKLGHVDRVVLEEVHWPDAGTLHVRLTAVVVAEGDQHAN